MRVLIRRTFLAAGGAALLAASSCKRRRRMPVSGSETEDGLASTVHVADPRAAMQLLRGFHDVEQNAWRWTKGKFAVTLRPPAGAAEKGAWLSVKLSVPEAILARAKTLSLAANVNGAPIPADTYATPGEYTYRREVPPGALAGDAVTVEFAVGNYIPAGVVEARELGLIVTSIGLEAK